MIPSDHQLIKEITINTFDQSVLSALFEEKIRPGQIEGEILTQLSFLYGDLNTRTLLLAPNLDKIARLLNNESKLLLFMYDHTNRFKFQASINELTTQEVLVDTITESIFNPHYGMDMHSLITQDNKSSLFLDEKTIRGLLNSNYWLIVMYFTMMYFTQTALYSSILVNLSEIKPK